MDCNGDLYNRRKRKHGRPVKGDELSGQDDHLKTADIVAQEIEVSPKTVRRAGEFAQVLDVITVSVTDRHGNEKTRPTNGNA